MVVPPCFKYLTESVFIMILIDGTLLCHANLINIDLNKNVSVEFNVYFWISSVPQHSRPGRQIIILR